tara:strand:+ start:2903 stop:3355 length:453 start_codon:yes stop_codon:yes gene_type:complete
MLNAQELPTEPAPGFSFPLGTKFTIEMFQVDSINFDFSIIEFEPFHEIVDTYETDSLFSENGKPGTIEFYFCYGSHGSTEKEKEKNMKILLVFKNRTEFNFTYLSDIKIDEDGEFQSTSNIGSYSGAKGTEMWPYMIYEIGLHDFKLNNR